MRRPRPGITEALVTRGGSSHLFHIIYNSCSRANIHTALKHMRLIRIRKIRAVAGANVTGFRPSLRHIDMKIAKFSVSRFRRLAQSINSMGSHVSHTQTQIHRHKDTWTHRHTSDEVLLAAHARPCPNLQNCLMFAPCLFSHNAVAHCPI